MSEQSLFTADEFKKLKKSKGVKRGKAEENIQLAVCQYLKHKYPNVIFFCDMSSGMKLPIWLAARNKKMKSSRGLPDLFISQPKWKASGDMFSPSVKLENCGLFVELKREDVRLKNGSISNSPHHKEQAEILYRLKQLGYKAEFACGYTEAINLIDNYLK